MQQLREITYKMPINKEPAGRNSCNNITSTRFCFLHITQTQSGKKKYTSVQFFDYSSLLFFSSMCYCCYSFPPHVMLGKASFLGVKSFACGHFTPAPLHRHSYHTSCFSSLPFTITSTCQRLHLHSIE